MPDFEAQAREYVMQMTFLVPMTWDQALGSYPELRERWEHEVAALIKLLEGAYAEGRVQKI